MAFRFVDIDHPPSEYEDFAVRELRPTLVQMCCFFIILSLFGAAGVVVTEDRLMLIPFQFIVLGMASYAVGARVHREREARRATELLNAIFASALGRGWRFCLIARKDGRIVYANPGFHALFDAGERTLAEWLAEKLPGVAAGGKGGEMPLVMAGKDGWQYPLSLVAEPVERPKGFVLLRARDNPKGAV